MAHQELARTSLPIPSISHGPAPTLDARDATAPDPIVPLRPPAGAPNVLIILVDDMGFGASSAFGGPCQMPNAERLANAGLRYNRFHTTALCSPSRQALLTGRNHHSVNMGAITELATSFPGNTTIRPDSAATLAQTLRLNGYSTAAFGKMHQTPVWETSVSGPFDRWPTGEGFDRFYGFVGAESNQYVPALIDGTQPIEPPRTPEEGYHLSEDLTDQCITWIRQQQALTPDKPFFAYLAFGATHGPHHVPSAWIAKNKGKFDQGWDQVREQTLARQKELGIVPQACELTPRPDELRAWDDLSADEKRVAAHFMEVYAAYAEHTDAQAGRVLDALAQYGVLDNTLVFCILGDNGASAEGGPIGTLNELATVNDVFMTVDEILPDLDTAGGPLAYNHFPHGWAHAMDTPYQWVKAMASHYGGTRTGMVVHWPGGIDAKGEVRPQFTHVIDIVPTILEAAQLPQPAFVNGIEQQPIEGTSLVYSFGSADAPERHDTQYFEIQGYRAIYHQGWVACTHHGTNFFTNAPATPFLEDVWELYAPDDWSQRHDLAAKQPEKLEELKTLFLIEAARYHVFPLDDRTYERFDSDRAGRPDLMRGRTSMTLYPGMTHLNENTVPNIKNKSFSVTAQMTVPDSGANGAIIAQGGRFGGWCLYLLGGVPAYCHNYLNLDHQYVRGSAPIAPGDHTLRFEFAYDGDGVGKGGTGTLLVDGETVGSGRIEKTIPNVFSADDFMDIGKDTGAPVTEDYDSPNGVFTGTIASVTIDIGQDVHEDPAGMIRAKTALH